MSRFTPDYGRALDLALLFYDAQRTGQPSGRLPWRGPSCLKDGADVGLDLSGGYVDAGDGVKFHFPLAYSLATLGWTWLDFPNALKQVADTTDHLREIFLYGAAYFRKCHFKPDALVAQVGLGSVDHNYWGPLETIPADQKRPSAIIDAQNPGSDLAYSVATVFAIAALITEDPAEKSDYLVRAKQLFDFATQYPGKYTDQVPDAKEFYNSTEIQDEYAFASLWMYRATTEPQYLTHFHNADKFLLQTTLTWTQCWDDKAYGCLVLATKMLPTDQRYKIQVEKYLDHWVSGVLKTPGGLRWLDQWGVLRYVASTCMMAGLYELYTGSQKYVEFCTSQIDYILGNNPLKIPYIVGYGPKSPKNPHHRGAHCSWNGDIHNPAQNRNVLYGALVGGPDQNDQYTDARDNYVQNEPACDYNAGLVGALTYMCWKTNVQYTAVPYPITDQVEWDVQSSILYSNSQEYDIRIVVMNKTCFPPRLAKNLVVQYQGNGKTFELKSSDCQAIVLKDGTSTKFQIGRTLYEGSNATFQAELQIRVKGANYTQDASYWPTSVNKTNPGILLFDASGTLLFGKPASPLPVPVPPPAPTPPAQNPPSTAPTLLPIFDALYGIMHDQYFAPQSGAPYHSLEPAIVEAPDHGHETTSEAYSYYVLLEVYGALRTGNLTNLVAAWNHLVTQIIPTDAQQPTTDAYNPSAPATFTNELDTPDEYPTPLQPGVKVGQDPLAASLKTAYNSTQVPGMHWIADVDDVYEFRQAVDGPTAPVKFNTYQRGAMEGVWDTVPQPSWEAYRWGGPNGYLDLFTGDKAYAKQWRYTIAPDAEGRVVQAMYRLLMANAQMFKDAQIQPYTDLVKKMGDYLRYCMFDKFFMKIGTQSAKTAGQGYDSCHYLQSWYYAWGGAIDTQAPWSWKIGCSHVHFGYQNPLAAYALSTSLKPKTPNAAADWKTSLQRQLELYAWLQSADGAFAAGATNSLNGRYDQYPAGSSTFYGMVYQETPVFQNPHSNLWMGWQVWSVERLAAYLVANPADTLARTILDRWMAWVNKYTEISSTKIAFPTGLAWSGQPNTFDPAKPTAINSKLQCTVTDTGYDVGLAASLAKVFMNYAKATGIDAWRQNAFDLLQYMWTHHRDAYGVGVERPVDFTQLDTSAHIPDGWTGKTPQGVPLNAESTFASIRPWYASSRAELLATKTMTYHRFWEQAEFATACMEYELLFNGFVTPVVVPPVVEPPTPPAPTPVPTPAPSNLTNLIIPLETAQMTITEFPVHANLVVDAVAKTVTYTPRERVNDRMQYTTDKNHLVKFQYAAVGARIEQVKEETWPGGFSRVYKITNTATQSMNTWKIQVVGGNVTQSFGVVGSNGNYAPESWNATIPPNGSVTFQLMGTAVPTSVTLQ